MKNRFIGLTVSLAALTMGCSSTPNHPAPSVLEIADLLISQSTMQKILDLKAKYEVEVKSLKYLDKFASEDLTPIRTELRIVGRYARKIGIPIEPEIKLTSDQEKKIQEIITDAEARFFNKYGWLRLEPSDAVNGYDNENPSLFTSEFLWTLWRTGFLKGELKQKYFDRIKTQVKAMELQPGLYDRYPVSLRGNNIRTFSHDEQLGLVILDKIFDNQLGFAKDQFQYGLDHDFVYLNAAWSGVDEFNRPIIRDGVQESLTKEVARSQRYGTVVEILRRAAGGTPTFGGDLLICAGMLLTLQHNCDESSERLMAYLQASLFKGQTEELDGCIYQFKFLTQEKFKKGNVCGGKPVTCDNMFCALSQIYFHNPEQPTRRMLENVQF